MGSGRRGARGPGGRAHHSPGAGPPCYLTAPMPFAFQVTARDPGCAARRGAFTTSHGRVETPIFMPVGTRASVTGLTPEDLVALDAQIILGNTYHLLLRPGPEVMRGFGGMHRFMGWDRAILTDSGGFQIFSLSADRTITEAGARFRSYIDNRVHQLTPGDLHRDAGGPRLRRHDGARRLPPLHRPGRRHARGDGPDPPLGAPQPGGPRRPRPGALRHRAGRPLPDHAGRVGRRSSRSTPSTASPSAAWRWATPAPSGSTSSALAAERIPADRPRYLMGVGTPPDILEAVGHGVDMFDCVIPTTMAWQGTAFTSTGRVRLTRQAHLRSDEPLDAACGCPTCRRHPRGYLHHLMKCKEPLGPRLLSVHNVHHYLQLMRDIRAAIEAGRYPAFARETLARIDRHEHDRAARPPGRRIYPGAGRGGAAAPAPGAAGEAACTLGEGRFTIVATSSGAPSVRDAEAGEVMHPVVGAEVEAERLYVAQSRLAERLAAGGAPLVLFDVGLGGARQRPGGAAGGPGRARRAGPREPAGRRAAAAGGGELRAGARRPPAGRLRRGGGAARLVARPTAPRRGRSSTTGRHEEAGAVLAARPRRGPRQPGRRRGARRPRLLGPLLTQGEPVALDGGRLRGAAPSAAPPAAPSSPTRPPPRSAARSCWPASRWAWAIPPAPRRRPPPPPLAPAAAGPAPRPALAGPAGPLLGRLARDAPPDALDRVRAEPQFR